MGPVTNQDVQTPLRSLWVLGHRVTPIRVGNRIAVLELVTPAGTPGPPPHYHEDAAEFFYVISGHLGVMSAGQWTSLGPGGYAQIPRGVVHTFRNESQAETRTITGYDVPGFEKWFEEFGYDTTEAGGYEASISEHHLRRVAAESSRYHMILAPDTRT